MCAFVVLNAYRYAPMTIFMDWVNSTHFILREVDPRLFKVVLKWEWEYGSSFHDPCKHCNSIKQLSSLTEDIAKVNWAGLTVADPPENTVSPLNSDGNELLIVVINYNVYSLC